MKKPSKNISFIEQKEYLEKYRDYCEKLGKFSDAIICTKEIIRLGEKRLIEREQKQKENVWIIRDNLSGKKNY